MQRELPTHRQRPHLSSGHPKRAVVGNVGGTIPPAWRVNAAQDRPTRRQAGSGYMLRNGDGNGRNREPRLPVVGSKILMSQLPVETVHERDIEELFAETIGPVFNVFIIYNSQGRSKGMAVVHFQRTGDAVEARKRYNGKIIDGRRPLRIELVIDPVDAPVKEKSLAARLGARLSTGVSDFSSPARGGTRVGNAATRPKPKIQNRVKKGPRRLKKSAEQLDREMEAYMADAPQITSSNIVTAIKINDSPMLV